MYHAAASRRRYHDGKRYPEEAAMKTLFKVMIALVAVGVLAVLFVRSAQSTRAQPFTIARQDLTGWTLTLAPDGDPLGSLLSLTPKATLLPPLSRDLFAEWENRCTIRQQPCPLVLRTEFQRAMAGALTPEALLNAARDAGLESAMLQPRCMARRRISSPGIPATSSSSCSICRCSPSSASRSRSGCVPPAVTRRSSIPRRCRLSSLRPIWMGPSAAGSRYARIRRSTALHRLSSSSHD